MGIEAWREVAKDQGEEITTLKKEIDRLKDSKKEFIYLATPYTHGDPAVREKRFLEVTLVAAYFVRKGENIFSPITHFHPMAKYSGLPDTWEFWREIDDIYLSHCKALYVLTADGWEESIGVQAEIAIAKELELPIYTFDFASHVLQAVLYDNNVGGGDTNE